jgi:hypothetical protein
MDLEVRKQPRERVPGRLVGYLCVDLHREAMRLCRRMAMATRDVERGQQ